jgi:hypothetical protein
MQKKLKILIATDYSEAVCAAEIYGINLARNTDSFFSSYVSSSFNFQTIECVKNFRCQIALKKTN